MNIIYIHKAEVHKRPPVLSVLMHLSALKFRVHLITCGISDEVRERLEAMGICIHVLPYSSGGNKFKKIVDYISFRKKAYDIINQIYKEDSLLWIESGYTIVALGKRVNKYKFVLQIQELHENDPLTLHAIGKVIHSAKAVFMPEYNRCVLYQLKYRLRHRPILLPNIPAFLPLEKDLERYINKYNEYLQKIKDKIVVVYQGYIIGADRPLDNYVRALKELGDKYQLVLIGKAGKELNDYISILPDLIHVDFVPSPEYLFFTKNAHIGIVSYDPMILNNAYCAPNKVFEYSNYGLPMIGNNIPGLKGLIEYYNAGKLVDEHSVEDIRNQINDIVDNYDYYSQHSRSLLSQFDNKETIWNVLDSLE